jgi:DNA topoisomerase-2
MAQDFVGANNIAWLMPQGQFGTRLQGGKDSASPRYIHTYLNPKVRKLVPADDFPVLTYRDDDGFPVEPEWYAPVLPMLLVNGARGIGTGYSTYVPPCDPKVLKRMLVDWLKGKTGALDEPIPVYYEGFKGLIAGGDQAIGKWETLKDGGYLVTELPPGTWTADYREWLEKELAEGRIKDFTDTSTDKDVHIVIKGIDNAVLQKSLVFQAKKTNMHAFNHRGQITKYASLNAILKEYAEVRLALYGTRKAHQLKAMENELPYHDNVMRFIEDQISDKPTIDLRRKTEEECAVILTKHAYAQIDGSFDYILKLPVRSFTSEQIAKHKHALETLRMRIAALRGKTPADLWMEDLQHV